MLSKEEELDGGQGTPDAEVTRQDQDKINAFSRLHHREKGWEEELGALLKDKEDLEEVATELELVADEDELVPYKIGDSFVSLPLSEVQDMLAQSTGQIDDDVARLEEKLQGIRDEMKELKVHLYARFGRSINLET